MEFDFAAAIAAASVIWFTHWVVVHVQVFFHVGLRHRLPERVFICFAHLIITVHECIFLRRAQISWGPQFFVVLDVVVPFTIYFSWNWQSSCLVTLCSRMISVKLAVFHVVPEVLAVLAIVTDESLRRVERRAGRFKQSAHAHFRDTFRPNLLRRCWLFEINLEFCWVILHDRDDSLLVPSLLHVPLWGEDGRICRLWLQHDFLMSSQGINVALQFSSLRVVSFYEAAVVLYHIRVSTRSVRWIVGWWLEPSTERRKKRLNKLGLVVHCTSQQKFLTTYLP